MIHATNLPEEMRTSPDAGDADLTLNAAVERAEKQAILRRSPRATITANALQNCWA